MAGVLLSTSIMLGCERVTTDQPPPRAEAAADSVPAPLPLLIPISREFAQSFSSATLPETIGPGFPLKKGLPADLTLPVDWKQDPYSDRSWRFTLHSWGFSWPLLHVYESGGESRHLRTASTLMLDWVRQHPPKAKGISEFAWYDMAVGLRAAALGYVWAHMQARSEGAPEERALLLSSAQRHGSWLARKKNYKPRNNHGLYQDLGLILLCRYATVLSDCDAWKRIATKRFHENVSLTVDEEDGVHLEHSPAYHITVGNLVHDFGELTSDARMKALATKMAATVAWFTMPDGTLPLVGDTDLRAAPKAAKRSPSGLRLFREAGYGVVKEDQSYLIALAAHHGRAHKHQDELSFCWMERGQRLITDSGRYGYYYEDPERQYAESSRAHNTLTLDSANFSLPRRGYGSGMLAASSASGIHAIAGRNPALPDGVRHERIWLFEPGSWLAVIDRVRSDSPRRLVRHFHVAPGFDIEAAASGKRFAATKPGLEFSLEDITSGATSAGRVVTGSKEPMQGFFFPENRIVKPAHVVEWVSQTSDGTLGAFLQLGPAARVHPKLVTSGSEVALRGEGLPEVVVALEGTALRLKVQRPANGAHRAP